MHPIDAVVEALPPSRILQERGDKIDPWFNRDDVTLRQRKIGSQGLETGSGIFGPSGKRAACVAHTQSDEMPEPMRKEKGVSLALDEGFGVPDHQAEVDKSGGDLHRGLEMDVLPLRAGPATADGAFLDLDDEAMQVSLERCRPVADDKRAGDIADVTANAGTGVDQDKVALAKRAGSGFEMEHGGVGPAADNAAIACAAGAGPLEGCLQLDLERAFGDAGGEVGADCLLYTSDAADE